MNPNPTSTLPAFDALANHIWCIDALHERPGNACVYLIGDNDQYALIETGSASSVDNVLGTMAQLGISTSQIRYVIPTHIHLDHAGAAGRFMRAFPAAHLLIHPRGKPHMIDPSRLVASSIAVYGEEAFGRLYGEILPIEEDRITTLEDGEHIHVGNRRLEFMHTRGHANHHFCIWDEHSRGWFSGDMFGVCYGPLRLASGDFVLATTTPTQFDPVAYRDSVHRLVGRQPERMYLTHYGELVFKPEQVEILLRQIDRYVEFGLRHGNDATAINTAIMHDLESQITARENAQTARHLREVIEPDARLNADGVAHWRSTSGR